jgi:hypothetical protein
LGNKPAADIGLKIKIDPDSVAMMRVEIVAGKMSVSGATREGRKSDISAHNPRPLIRPRDTCWPVAATPAGGKSR